MRIIAGEFRRRQLAAAPGGTTRPLTDQAKERLFERLGEFEGQRIADVFSGTGTIGLEALSRGAESVTFFERDHKAFALLRQNIATLGVEDYTFCWRVDVLRCSFRPKGFAGLLPFDRVFFDPPYAIASDLQPGGVLYRALARLTRPGITADDAELILRTPVRLPIAVPAVWKLDRQMDIGSMTIGRYTRSGVTPDAADDEAADDGTTDAKPDAAG